MYYIEYEVPVGIFNCNYNSYGLYKDCLEHFRRSGRVILSHGRRPA